MPTKPAGRIAVESVIRPGKLYRIDQTKYEAMRATQLGAGPKTARV